MIIMTYMVFLRVTITMSAFVIVETTNNKHYSIQLKTHARIVSGKFFKQGCKLVRGDDQFWLFSENNTIIFYLYRKRFFI